MNREYDIILKQFQMQCIWLQAYCSFPAEHDRNYKKFNGRTVHDSIRQSFNWDILQKHRSQSNRCRIRPYEDSDETDLNDLFWKQYSLGKIYCTGLSSGKLELLGVNERGICNYFC